MTTSPAELLAHLDKIRSDGFTVSVSEQTAPASPSSALPGQPTHSTTPRSLA
ncbi:hypothetical protein [Rhodococcus oxybenzonivorans]|uniref:hypothetical protein n=1 Tax=Rhodococcus oxybenzonivorans TaxID=1990687 RepID=UPI001E4872E0|nr:hypothetical protein [Rhodococcus oxybenzonivorans]